MVNRSCTPLSDLKRASRTGPFAVTKGGILFVAPFFCPTVNCGFWPAMFPTKGKAFMLGDVPPVAGCEWQGTQEALLEAGPNPPLPGPAAKLTGSTSINCANPL